MSYLLIDGLTVTYGAVRAVSQLSLSVEQGETVALIGPNGAGKSSLLMTIAGVVQPSAGTILLKQRPIAALGPEHRVSAGISVVPETRDVFKKLTVHENLLIGASTRRGARAETLRDVERMYALFPRLLERTQHMAGFLSGGEQQMLAIARALMAHPKLLMLDEPSLGLAPVVTDAVYDAIRALKAEGTTILLVEQNSARAFGVCDHAHLMRSGEIVESGTPQDLRRRGSIEAVMFGQMSEPAPLTQSGEFPQ